MTTESLRLFWALILVPPAIALAQAPPQTAPVVGHVLMLDNESVLEGEITRDDGCYVIKRPVGEIKVPVAKAWVVCAGMDEAFKILSSRRNLRDADERVRLARWCQTHGLHDQAVEETKAALALRPGHSEARQLLAILQRTPTPSQLAGPDPEPARTTVDTPLVEVSADCLALFTTKVHPIMINTCASCHAGGRSGSFVLTRSTDASGRRATQVNLSAAVKQICFEQPACSPLLYKACCAHGGGVQPPLGANQAVPFETLKAWVELVVARNPHLRAEGAAMMAGPAPAPRSPEQPAVVKTMPVAADASQERSVFRTVPMTAEATTGTDAQAPLVPGTGQPAAAPKQLTPVQAAPLPSNDPHDPTIFNQMFHPKQ
jgi:hypothetical protein